jgi:mannose-6-phosphate isomerase-like protein (cupin superfamily)
VDAEFAKIQDSWDVYTKTNHAVTFRVATKSMPATNHQEADEYWFVRKGTATVTLNTGAAPATSSVSGGDVLYVPRDVPYAIEPSARFEYVALRIFTPRSARGAGPGGEVGAQPTSYFAKKADIDKTFASESRTTQLRFPGGVNVAMIIYDGAIGPYESHSTVDQIYFVRHGSAKAAFDGRLVNPVVTTPGQVRGTGYLDSSEYTIGPGDIVWLPRNQLHFVDPGIGKIGYFLVGMPTSQSGFPQPPPDTGRGGGAK